LLGEWFGIAGIGAGKGWVAGGLDCNQLGIGHGLDELVDVIGDGVDLSHGVAKLLKVFLKVVEGLVVT